jgi:hypothetical protein
VYNCNFFGQRPADFDSITAYIIGALIAAAVFGVLYLYRLWEHNTG